MLTYADSGRCSGGAMPAMVEAVWVCLACSLLLFAFFCFIFIPFVSSLIRSAVVGGIGLTFNHPKVRSRPLCPYIYECICVYLLGSYVCLCRGVWLCCWINWPATSSRHRYLAGCFTVKIALLRYFDSVLPRCSLKNSSWNSETRSAVATSELSAALLCVVTQYELLRRHHISLSCGLAVWRRAVPFRRWYWRFRRLLACSIYARITCW